MTSEPFVSLGVRKPAQTLHAEHGVELLQEDQPRVEAAGEQAAAPPPFVFFLSSSLLQSFPVTVAFARSGRWSRR